MYDKEAIAKVINVSLIMLFAVGLIVYDLGFDDNRYLIISAIVASIVAVVIMEILGVGSESYILYPINSVSRIAIRLADILSIILCIAGCIVYERFDIQYGKYLVIAAIIGAIIGVILKECFGENARESTRYQKKYTMRMIDAMDPFEFEKFICDLFIKMGYSKSYATPSRGDFGADVIAIKGQKKIAVQVKHYTGSTGNKAVQEVIAARAFYKTQDAMVITTSYFTRAAIKMGAQCNVRLIAREELRSMVAQYM